MPAGTPNSSRPTCATAAGCTRRTTPPTRRKRALRSSRARFDEKLAKDPGVYGAWSLARCRATGAASPTSPPGGADLVLTFRNVHNWIEDGHIDATLRAFFAVLKPGGVLGVEEHRATVSTPLTWLGGHLAPEKNGHPAQSAATHCPAAQASNLCTAMIAYLHAARWS